MKYLKGISCDYDKNIVKAYYFKVNCKGSKCFSMADILTLM